MCIFLRRHITIPHIKQLHKTTLVSTTPHKFAVPIIRRSLRFSKASYTITVKLSDFTVWRHTWWENWVNCALLTGKSAVLRTVLSSRLSHRELRSSLRESHSFLSLPADTTMASSQGTSVSSNPFSRWTSHDSFSNATSYCTFYAFFSSFRITLWPMWLANSRRQPCFYPPQSHAQEYTKNWQKNWQIWREKTCAVPENIQFSFSCSFFYIVKLHS